MSRKVNDVVECPECKESISYERWESVNTDINPEEKQRLLSGTFGEVVCPKCGAKLHLEYDFLYHDIQGKYMISVGSDFSDVLNQFERPEGYRYRYVERISNLVEKINIFDSKLNDIAIEIMKEVIKELLHIKEKLIYLKAEENGFLFYMLDSNKAITIKSDMYCEVLENCDEEDLEEKYEFMKVGN